MLDHEMKAVEDCLKGLLHYLPGKHEKYDLKHVILRRDRQRDRDNKKQARNMACASINRQGVPVIGIAQNLAAVPKPFVVGVLLHELTHIAFNLGGSGENEVDVDATIMELVPEANYRYFDVEFRDLTTGKHRKARNLQLVEDEFANYCCGWWAEKCEKDRVEVKK